MPAYLTFPVFLTLMALLGSTVQIELLNRQRKYQIALKELLDFGESVIPRVLAVARREDLPERVLVVFVSDRKISQIHARFMGIPDPTDVLTFQHGEIIISVETAARQATDYRTNLLHELRLYLTHGLLHLAGYDDHSEEGFREMSALQEEWCGTG